MVSISLTVLAVDPGLQKCGLAVVNEEITVFEKLIILSEQLIKVARNLCRQYSISLIILGDGTGCKKVYKDLTLLGITINIVDENKSSIEGRYKYLKENTKGWSRIIPIGLRIPAQPFDDYVAIVLAERFFMSRSCAHG